MFAGFGVWSQPQSEDPPAGDDGTADGPGTGEPTPTPPCAGGPGETYSIDVFLDEEQTPPLIVSPDPAPAQNRAVEQCDIIVFNNKTGRTVTLDFNPQGGEGSPFFGESLVTISAEGSAQEALQVKVDPEQVTEYDYTVTSEGLSRSPVIRVGPRDD
jgi:hypothetical protein